MGLAPALVQANFELIQQIHSEGVAIFMVEQNANMALSIADRGWVLQTGKVVLDDNAEALLANPDLRASYLGETDERLQASQSLRGRKRNWKSFR